MTKLMDSMGGATPRRGFFARMAGAVTLGLAGLSASPLRAQTTGAASSGPDWPGALKGQYKQVVDAYDVNAGFPLAFVYTFLATNEPSNSTGVLDFWPGKATPADLEALSAAPAEAWTGKLVAARKVLRTIMSHRVTTGTFQPMVVEAAESAGEFVPATDVEFEKP